MTFTCSKDVHYAKALLGSIRHFYPDRLIHVVLDNDVPVADENQMSRFPNVRIHHVANLIQRHKLDLRGLLAKLNVFFLPEVSAALVADADSILTGPILENIDLHCELNSLNSETLDLENADERAIFNRWAIDLQSLNSKKSLRLPTPCKFVQGSHFYVNVSSFPKSLLYTLLPDMTHTHTATHHLLRAGDQGFWNYVANFDTRLGILAKQTPVTLQVGGATHRDEYDTIAHIERNSPKDFYFIHYVGFSRRFLRQRHEYSAALTWGTRLYYEAVGRTEFIPDEIRRTLRVISRTALGGLRLLLKPFLKQLASE